MSEQQNEQIAGSAEQPVQQPEHTQPEQVAPAVEQPYSQPANPAADDATPAPDVADSGAADTTDQGDGAGDQPTDDEQAAAGDVSEPAPGNVHVEDGEPGSAGLGVTGKFVTDPDAQDAGVEDAGSQ